MVIKIYEKLYEFWDYDLTPITSSTIEWSEYKVTFWTNLAFETLRHWDNVEKEDQLFFNILYLVSAIIVLIIILRTPGGGLSNT